MKKIIEGNINRIALIIGLIGIITSFFIQNNSWIGYFARFLNPVYLGFYLTNRINFFIGSGTSYINIFYYSVLLYGVYTNSRNKDSRLLKFSFAIIFLQSTVGIVSQLISTIIPNNFGQPINYTALVLGLLSSILFTYISYVIVKYLLKDDKATYTERELREKTIRQYTSARKETRLFHHLFDIVIALLSLTLLLLPIITRFLEPIGNLFGGRVAFLILVAFIRFFYLLIFETTFSATPAKMLSNTKTIDQDGNNVSFGKALGRTCARWIPFEPFSFLSYGGGWHDTITETTVSKIRDIPQRSSIWWLIPLFIIASLGIKYIPELIHDYKRNSYNKECEAQNQKSKIGTYLEPTIGDYIFTQASRKPYNSSIMKVISQKEDSLFVEMYIGKTKPKIKAIRELMTLTPASKFYISQSEIRELKKYGNKVVIPNVDYNIRLTKIDNIDRLNLISNGSSRSTYEDGISTSTMSMKIENIPGQLVAIKNLKGDIEWKNTLPEEISLRNNVGTFNLIAEGISEDSRYDIELTFIDEDNIESKFLIMGFGTSRKAYRIE